LTGRVDYELSSKNKFFHRFIYDHGPFQYDGPWPGSPDASRIRAVAGDLETRNTADPDEGIVLPWSKNFLTGWTHIFNTQLVSDFRFGFDRRTWGAHHSSSGLGFPQQLGIPVPKPIDPETPKFGDPNDHFPNFNAAGYRMPGGGQWGAGRYEIPAALNFYFVESMTYIRKAHSFKAGIEVRRSRQSLYDDRQSSGTYNFQARGTARNPGDTASSGDSFASFLLDWPDGGSLVGVTTRTVLGWWYAPYFQDDWRISRNLTINLGVRYEYDTPRRELRGNFYDGFDLNALNPVCNCPGTVIFPETFFDPDKNNFMPRLGFSWNPRGGSTVVRGGFGIFYNMPVATGNAGLLSIRPDFAANVNLLTTDNGITAPFFMGNGLPPPPPFDPSKPDPGLGAVPIGSRTLVSPTYMDRNAITPYNLHFNFNVQHQLSTGYFFEVGWLGNMGHHLQGILSHNQIPIQRARIGATQAERPFPQFTDVREENASLYNSTYHALIVKAEKRYRNGLSFVSNYTWTKFLDDRGNMDFYNRQINKGLADDHRTSRIVFSGAYDLPAGKGRAVLNEGVLSNILGGWTLAGQYIWQSGQPLTPTISPDQCFCFPIGPNRPNRVGDPNMGPKTINNWFNLSAFEHPGTLAFGNSARNVIIGPSLTMNDVSLSKNFHFTESKLLNFRTDFFNVTNLVNYGNPSTTIFPAGSPGTTNIIRSAGDPRRIQLGAKFIF
jgi:hypothetical protein